MYLNRKKPAINRLSLAALLVMSTSAFAQDYSGVIVLGDSLSDGGIYGSRFTTNPGMTSVEYLAQDLGFQLTTSTAGGTNYAQGGARVASDSASTPAGFAQRPISTQVTEYLSKNGGVADPNALHIIQGGANDIFQNFAAVQAGLMSTAEFQSSLISTGSAFVGQTFNLHLAGAKYIVVPNLPNLGATPAFSGATAPLATQASQGFNQVVRTGLSQIGIDMVALDTYGLLNEVVAQPATYGFSNATGVACTTSTSLLCSPATLVSADAAQTYVFADGVHPTDAMHRLNAQYMLSVLKAPTQVSVLGIAPLAQAQGRQSLLFQKMAVAGDSKWHTFATYDHSRAKFDEEADSRANGLLAGVDRLVGKNGQRLGVSVGYQNYSGKVGGSGSYRLSEPSVGLYFSTPMGSEGKSQLLATMSYGHLDYSRIKRAITLGAATRNEVGSTSGQHWSFGVSAKTVLGTFANGQFEHGPEGGLQYEDIKVKGYSEDGQLSTSMTFGEQRRRGWLANIGYRMQGQMGRFSPYAKVAYELDHTHGNDVRAKVTSQYNGFSTPAYVLDNGFRFELGTGFKINDKAQVNLGMSTTLGKTVGRSQRFDLGVEARF